MDDAGTGIEVPQVCTELPQQRQAVDSSPDGKMLHTRRPSLHDARCDRLARLDLTQQEVIEQSENHLIVLRLASRRPA